MNLAARTRFLDELAVLLSAGSTPTRAFQVLKTAYAPGSPVSQACRPLLDGFHARLLEASEAAGGLEDGLKAVAGDLRFRLEMRRKITNGLAYPVLLVHAGILIPPVGALFLDSASAYARTVLPSLVLFHALILVLWRLWGGFRGLAEVLPMLGTPLRRLAEARLLQALAITVRAGLPVGACLRLSAEASGNRRWRSLGLSAEGRIARGAKVHEVLRLFPCFPGELAGLVEIAEETGGLDGALARMAKAARAEAELAIETSVARFEVVAQWGAAAFAAFQILAMAAGLF